MPAILLSGFMFPIENMPVVFQYATYANPLRYFLVIIRGIFLKGNGFFILWPQLAALLLLGMVRPLALATRERVQNVGLALVLLITALALRNDILR